MQRTLESLSNASGVVPLLEEVVARPDRFFEISELDMLLESEISDGVESCWSHRASACNVAIAAARLKLRLELVNESLFQLEALFRLAVPKISD